MRANASLYKSLCGGNGQMSLAGMVATGMIIVSSATLCVADELGFAGPGAQNCGVLNQNAQPGRGSDQNLASMLIFSWVQGYMSGFNGYSYMIGNNRTFNLGAASPAAQWEYLVSFCRSNPHLSLVRGIQDLQLKLLPPVDRP